MNNTKADNETRPRPHASTEEREAALLGILATMNRVLQSLAENHPSLGLGPHAAEMQRQYDVIDPPMETPEQRHSREETEARNKAAAKEAQKEAQQAKREDAKKEHAL